MTIEKLFESDEFDPEDGLNDAQAGTIPQSEYKTADELQKKIDERLVSGDKNYSKYWLKDDFVKLINLWRKEGVK